MIDPAESRRHAVREASAWLSFAIFLGTSMSIGAIFAFRVLPAQLGIDMDHHPMGVETLWIIGIVVLVMIFLVYVGAIAWMLFARVFFSKAEVSKVVFHGLSTRFDHWLVDTLFRKDR